MVTGFIWMSPFIQADEELFDPVAIYLTWQQDPATTMTIDWHTTPDDGERPSVVHYKLKDDVDWIIIDGEAHDFPFSKQNDRERIINRVELTNLEAASLYRFRFGENSEEYSFRTMPLTLGEQPVVFAAGGDTRRGDEAQELMERTNRVVMEYDIDFIAWGGDLAYADGLGENLFKWEEWFDAVKNSLIDETGRVIPIIISTGNHDLQNGYYYNHEDYEQNNEYRRQIAPYFFDLFAFPGQPGYGVLDFGDYLSMISIDTDHINPIEGEQIEWLEQTLSERTHVPNVLPFYHVPAYPSHRWDDDRTVSNVKKFLPPLFEQYDISVALENHDHAYKRTWPIKDNEIAEDGIVYIGDGAWGLRDSSIRSGRRKDEGFINQFESVRHAIIVTLNGENQDYVMVNDLGEIIDTFNTGNPVSLPPPSPPPAPADEAVLIRPLHSPPMVELQPEFAWHAIEDASHYQFQLTDESWAMILDTTMQDTLFKIPVELNESEYYRWRVRGLNESGDGPWSNRILIETVSTQHAGSQSREIPVEFMLDHNYPNPFNPVTTIRYGLPVPAHVDLRVYDVIGREVSLLVNELRTAGYHTTEFDTGSMNTGLYVYRIRAIPDGTTELEGFSQSRSMTIIK